MKTKDEVLQNCTVEGNVVKLPNEVLDRKLMVSMTEKVHF